LCRQLSAKSEKEQAQKLLHFIIYFKAEILKGENCDYFRIIKQFPQAQKDCIKKYGISPLYK
jgi:hypothetical protein